MSPIQKIVHVKDSIAFVLGPLSSVKVKTFTASSHSLTVEEAVPLLITIATADHEVISDQIRLFEIKREDLR